MKKNKVIIIILSVIIVILTGILIYQYININNKYEKRRSKKEHYTKIENKIKAYSKIFFTEITIPEERKKGIIHITLESLEKRGFPVDDINSYDGKKCDKTSTYTLVSFKDNDYEFNVYYKCGKDSNYK